MIEANARHIPPVLDKRRAGVVLHPTSLPAGDIGADAHRWIDLAADAGVSVWQMLPLVPTHTDGSPYNGLSVHAADPRLIDLADLVERGWLAPHALAAGRLSDEQRALALRAAHAAFTRHAAVVERTAFVTYAEREAHWLDDYALFQALRGAHATRAWWEWPVPLRDREPNALTQARVRLADEVARVKFEQFVFARQWSALRAHAGARGVKLFGDMPIFVAHDSAEVWARREYFRLTPDGQPEVVAGVPPDYFSEHGQRWGNPLYDWERMRADGFRFWIARLTSEFTRFDFMRVDHFRGFEACWEIPATDSTAVNGRWVPAPGAALFDALRAQFGALPLVAEDLGLITPAVEQLRRRYGLPGMRVLQFAFDGGADNPYLPHNYEPDTVVYTGTHDNDTTIAWYESLTPAQQERMREYLGYPDEPMPWPLVRAAYASVARLAIVPMQDLLGLGRGHRMNTPGSTHGNWNWRFEWRQLDPAIIGKLNRLVEMYGRKSDRGG